NKDVHFCPVCNTSRWKDSITPGKKDPKKVLRYFSIIPRLQYLHKSSHTTKEMTWHATGKCTEPGKMQHLVDSRAWKNFDTKYPDFVKEQKNVRLGLAADGFNPFGNLSQSYIMWPMILTTYNLPPWLCMKESSFMLTLLIPGPKSPSKDIDIYLRPLIDNLKDLLGKTAYVGYRRFLKKPYIWKRSLDFSGEIKDEDPPRKFDRDDIMDQLARFPTRVKGKHLMYGGLKSHDCHIMMQRLLPYGLQQYLPIDVAKPIIELCLFFKQICSQTLIEDDMLKAQSKVVNIVCNLELTYPPGFFDIMIHLVIHLPLEALEGGPIRPWWMYPFERYMKKLKNYDVTMKFNRPDRNKQMQSSATQEYPSLIQTFFDTHTVGGIFLRDKDRRLYEEMLRLHGLGTYTDDQIMAMVRRGKQRGHIPGVGRVLAGRSQHENESGSGSGAGGDDESSDDEDADEDEDDADS
ncbi:pyruvate kinase, partial [Tanacetum coccineum]